MTDFIRAVALDDIRIRSGGTGRTVEAYAAIFNEPAEIVDAGRPLPRGERPGVVQPDHRAPQGRLTRSSTTTA
jgi:hypothetical protein